MILTNCAACAAPLAHDAPRCVRCETRYCSVTCQQFHWRRLSGRGHEQICEEIHRSGGAEQYHAEEKYKELLVQSNLANTYRALGRLELALRLQRDVYSGTLRIEGEESRNTLLKANNYVSYLISLKRFEEAKTLLPRIIPTAQRVLGESDTVRLRMRWIYAMALYEDPAATLDDLREAVTTLEEIERTALRVLGGANPLTLRIERHLRNARAALRARETREV